MNKEDIKKMNNEKIANYIRQKFAFLQGMGIKKYYNFCLDFNKLMKSDLIDGQNLSFKDRLMTPLSDKVVYSNEKIRGADLRESDFVAGELLECKMLLDAVKNDTVLTKRSDLKQPLETYINFLENKCADTKPKKPSEQVRTIFLNLAFLNGKYEDLKHKFEQQSFDTEVKQFIKDFKEKHNTSIYKPFREAQINFLNKYNLKAHIETYDQAVTFYENIFNEEPKITTL